MIADINSEDRLVQQTFADHLRDRLGWESVYAYNAEIFGSHGTLGRASERDVVLVRDLRSFVRDIENAFGYPVGYVKQKGFHGITREAFIFMELAMGIEPATC